MRAIGWPIRIGGRSSDPSLSVSGTEDQFAPTRTAKLILEANLAFSIARMAGSYEEL